MRIKRMGNTNSKTRTKQNKIINDEKLIKIGLGVGKGDERLEGNFQFGWVRRTKKSYSKPNLETIVEEEDHQTGIDDRQDDTSKADAINGTT